MRPAVWVIEPLMALAGCSGTPDCDDGDVEDLVFDKIRGEAAKQAYAPKRWLPLGATLEQVLQGNDAEAIKTAREVLKQAATASMDLSAIRTPVKDDAIKQVQCAATLGHNDNPIEITYTVQYTEDGMLHATVYGL